MSILNEQIGIIDVTRVSFGNAIEGVSYENGQIEGQRMSLE